MIDHNTPLEELDESIYDRALISRYRKYTVRVRKFKLKDELDTFVINALNILAEIMPTRKNDALPVEDLADILSDFPSCEDLLAMKDYRKRLSLPVTTLIRCLEMHGHLRHQEAIFDPLELSEKENKSVRDKTGILLLHIC